MVREIIGELNDVKGLELIGLLPYPPSDHLKIQLLTPCGARHKNCIYFRDIDTMSEHHHVNEYLMRSTLELSDHRRLRFL